MKLEKVPKRAGVEKTAPLAVLYLSSHAQLEYSYSPWRLGETKLKMGQSYKAYLS